MDLRRLSRRIKCRPLVRFRKLSQKITYRAIGNTGALLFNLLRDLKLMPLPQAYDASRIKRILIIRPDRIGDLILATPVFYNLRAGFPKAHIALLIKEQNRDLVNGNPHLDELITIKRGGLAAVFRSRITSRLKAAGFDLAVVLYPSLWSCLLAFLAGIPYRVGYDFHGSGFLLTLKLPYAYEENIEHEVDVNLNLLKAISIIPQKKQLEISIDSKAEERVARFLELKGVLPQDRMAVVHPGAYEEYIRWKVSGFAQVADFLIEDFKMRVIILAGPKEEKLAERMTSLMKNKPVAATGLGLGETIALIKRAKIFIGNSTGPMHIAAALKIPVVAIFGSRHPLDNFRKWGPYGVKSIVVQKDTGCQPCEPGECSSYRCMEEIKKDDVIRAARELLGG
jgi:heptosyltransferase-2